MTKTEIIEGNKLIAKYLGYKYVPSNDLIVFYNSFDALIPAIEKLEEEDLSEYHYSWVDAGSNKRNNFMNVEFNRFYNESWVLVNLELDPAMQIGKGTGGGIIKDTFKAVVESITYINNLRDVKKGE